MSLLADGLSLSQIRILDPWSTAKLGTLVQASVQGKQVIGIRTIFKAGNGDTDALIVVSGDSVAGQLFSQEEAYYALLWTSQHCWGFFT